LTGFLNDDLNDAILDHEYTKAQEKSQYREQNKYRAKANIKSLNRLKMQTKISWAKRNSGKDQSHFKDLLQKDMIKQNRLNMHNEKQKLLKIIKDN